MDQPTAATAGRVDRLGGRDLVCWCAPLDCQLRRAAAAGEPSLVPPHVIAKADFFLAAQRVTTATPATEIRPRAAARGLVDINSRTTMGRVARHCAPDT